MCPDRRRMPEQCPNSTGRRSKDGIRYLLVSWYAKDEAAFKGSRITLIDISPSSSTYLTYRHILLVQPDIPASVTDYSQYASYAPLNVHAGGMAYFKGKLYISSTNLGVRVFDLNKIIEVSTGDTTNDKCGKDSNGNLFAFNYRYILPQTGYQKINNANPFSTIQVNDEGTQFWTGQYYSGSADALPLCLRSSDFPSMQTGSFRIAESYP